MEGVSSIYIAGRIACKYIILLTIIRWAGADNITLGQGPTRIVKDDTENS